MGIWVFNFKIPNLYKEENKPVVGEPEPDCEYQKNTSHIDNLFNSMISEITKALKINEKMEEVKNSLMNSKLLMGQHADKFSNFMKDTGSGMSKGLGDFTQLSKEKLGNLVSGTSELTGNLKEGLKGLKLGFKDGVNQAFQQGIGSLISSP
jgi:hypothetical protein